MRKLSLYPVLAWQSVRNNRRFYLPYLLALLGNVAAMYIMSALVNDPGTVNMVPGRPGAADYIAMFMTLGMVVAVIFSTIFVFYINGFLMKRRRKELGLYNILGMGKGNIALILLFETLYMALGGIGGGLLAGILFHKLASLALYKMMDFPVPFGLSVSWKALAETTMIFGVLLGLTLLVNLNKVRASRPVELLKSGNVGEREPKTRWLLTVLGIGTLGTGYVIAIRTRNGVEAIGTYFVAVFLVIIGTYCLFTAVSIFILKALKLNKRFYYKTSHFIGVSGMLYRMKQNAVGLANICILCTMVMVMISGTLSLYLGTGQIVKEQYPGDINITVYYAPGSEEETEKGPFDPEAMAAKQAAFIESQGYQVSNIRTCLDLGFGAGHLPDGTYTTDRFAEGTGGVVEIVCVTEDFYEVSTGEGLDLDEGQIAAYGVDGDELTIRWTVPDSGEELEQTTYKVAKHLSRNPRALPYITDLVTVVVRDEAAMNEFYRLQAKAYGQARSNMAWYAYLDVDATEEGLTALEDAYENASKEGLLDGTGSWWSSRWELQSEGKATAYAMAGGFLFLGVLLGLVFLMATVLIIYYKQISEGYEDKARFEIMQQVGLSREEVRSSIRGQILTVFFLPIAVAAVHILFDFNMVVKLLTLFYLQDTAITALCTLGTVLVFFIVYGVVYLLTARTYYKIVERA